MGQTLSYKSNKRNSISEKCRVAREKIAVAREQYLSQFRKDTIQNICSLDHNEEDCSVEKLKQYKYPFENLIFEGGGVKGISYAGFVRVLEENGIMQQIKRFAGSSSGSVAAAMFAVGYNSYDLAHIMGVDFGDVLCDSWFYQYLPNMLKGYGLNVGNRMYNWYGAFLAVKTGDPDITFEEIYKRYHKELCIVVVNVSTSEEEYCHVKTTPDMPVRLALRMSCSLPGILQPVKSNEENVESFFVDGGVLCNYPIHCYDGWWLSMKKEDWFLSKMQPIDDLDNLMSNENRFAFDPTNQTTLGAVVFSESEQKQFKRLITSVVSNGKLPDTKMARQYTKNKLDETRKADEYKMIATATTEFLKVLSDNNTDDNPMISREEFRQAFQEETFSPENKKVLFGENVDWELAFTAVDNDGSDEIEFRELVSFIESLGLSLYKKITEHERRHITGVLSFLSHVVNGINENASRIFFKNTDIERTVGINTRYVKSTTTDLEDGDKTFLLNQGTQSTRRFLKNFIEKNQLRQLTPEEIENIYIPNSMSVSEEDVKHIVTLRNL